MLGIGLAIALWPFATGLIGAPVLAVVCRTPFNWLANRIRPSIAAAIVVAAAALILIVPGLSFAAVAVAEAQRLAGDIARSPEFAALEQLSIGGLQIGQTLLDFGEAAVSWVGTGAFLLLGTATRVALNVTIAMFGLYFLLSSSHDPWEAVRPYIPFSDKNKDKLRKRFRDVTNSTLIGTGFVALVQGTLVGIAFEICGLPSPVFWGVVTGVFAILPIVGSGLIWGPGALALLLTERYLAGAGLFVWGIVIVASVDNLIRPLVYKKWARVHPLITLVGALGGVRFFGVLGLLIGPLALSYFFELILMFRDEYLLEEDFLQMDAL